MDRLGRLSDTEAKLLAIVKRARKYLNDFEITEQFNSLHPEKFQKTGTLERRLRDMRESGRLKGGKYTRKAANGPRISTRYRVAV